jgi:hypothetical protein
MIGIAFPMWRLLALGLPLLMLRASLRADDQPLIPEALNQRLPRIVAGMSTAEIEKALAPAYPKAKARVGIWSGQTGYIDVQIDERFSISIAGENGRDGQSVVHKDILIYVFDHTQKRRVELRQYDWDKAPGTAAAEKSKKE